MRIYRFNISDVHVVSTYFAVITFTAKKSLWQRKKDHDSEKKCKTAKKIHDFFFAVKIAIKILTAKKSCNLFSLSRLFFAVMYFFRCHDFSTRSTFCRSFLSKLINENEKFHLFLNIFILLNVFEDCIKVM